MQVPVIEIIRGRLVLLAGLYRRFGWRHLWMHRGRAVTVLAGIAIGAAVFASVRLSVNASLAAFTSSVAAFTGSAQFVVTRSGGRLPETLVAALLKDPDVRHATAVMSTYVRHPDHPDESFLLVGVDPILDAPFRQWAAAGAPAERRQEWTDLMRMPFTAIAGEGLLRQFRWRPGDSVTLTHALQSRDFRLLAPALDEGISFLEGGLFLAEGFVLGTVGWLAALPLGGALTRAMLAGVSGTINTLFVRVQVERLHLSAAEIVLSYLLTAGVSTLAAAQPATEAMRVPPREAMRIDAGGTAGRGRPGRLAVAGGLCLMLAVPVSRLPGWAGQLPLPGYVATVMLFAGFSLMAPLGLRLLGTGASPLLRRLGMPAYLAGRYVRDSGTRTAVSVDLGALSQRVPDLGWTGVRFYLDTADPPGDEDLRRLEQAVATAGGGRLDQLSGRRLRTTVMAIFDDTFSVTTVLLVIALAVAALGIATTLTVLVLDRRRQLNTILAVGGAHGQIRQMILWESAILVAAGEAAGLVCGFMLSYLLIYVINPQSFGWSFVYRVDWPALALSVPLVVVVALVAAIPALGAVLRGSPGALLREI